MAGRSGLTKSAITKKVEDTRRAGGSTRFMSSLGEVCGLPSRGAGCDVAIAEMALFAPSKRPAGQTHAPSTMRSRIVAVPRSWIRPMSAALFWELR